MYAQKNYPDVQGVNGKYKISQIGCFLTSFSNLLERFGRGVAPDVLNKKFRDSGWFVDLDDGIVDDLKFNSITKYDPNIVVEEEGPRTSNMPTHRNAIVRIAAGNQFGTHFCLVDRIENGVVWVVDSYDGTVKKASAYGPIQGWATYKDNKGDDMVTKDDLPLVRIVMSEVEGWPGEEIHAGKHDKAIIGTWAGKSWQEFLWHCWNVQPTKRHNLAAKITELTKAQKIDRDEISRLKKENESLKTQIGDASAATQLKDALLRFLGLKK